MKKRLVAIAMITTLVLSGCGTDEKNEDTLANNQVAEPVATATAGEEKSDNDVPENTSYVAQAKIEREQVRTKEKDMLTEMINSPDTPEENKSVAQDRLLEIQQRIDNENAIEAIIESEGFDEVYVRIYDDTVEVVVNKAELIEQEIAQIQTIVSEKTGLSADTIKINTVKINTVKK